MFWSILLPTSLGLSKKKLILHVSHIRVPFWTILKMEAEYTSATLVLILQYRSRLRCCATNREVSGSIPDGVIGIFY